MEKKEEISWSLDSLIHFLSKVLRVDTQIMFLWFDFLKAFR